MIPEMAMIKATVSSESRNIRDQNEPFSHELHVVLNNPLRVKTNITNSASAHPMRTNSLVMKSKNEIVNNFMMVFDNATRACGTIFVA